MFRTVLSKTDMRLIKILVVLIVLAGCGEKSAKKETSDKPLTNQDKIIKYSKEIQSKPTASGYSKRAMLYADMNERSLALDDIKSAIELDSTNGKIYYQAAEIFRKDKRINASINFAIKATQYGYNEGDVYILLGENYLIFRKYQAAIDNLNEAMKMDRFNEKVYFLKGMVYKESQEYKEAQSSYQTAIELNPQYAEAYNQLITLALQQKDYDLAQNYLESGLRFNPEDPFLWFNQGVSLQDQNLLDSAVVPYLKSIRYDSTITIASFNLGWVYHTKSEFQKSLQRMNHVLKIQPNNVQAFYLKALNLSALNKNDEAVEELKKALRINPEYKEAMELYEKLK